MILTAGRFAGRKAVVLKSFDQGEGKRQYGHAVVAGVDTYPLPVTRSMSTRKVLKLFLSSCVSRLAPRAAPFQFCPLLLLCVVLV